MFTQAAGPPLPVAATSSQQAAANQVCIRRAVWADQPVITALVRSERLNPNDLDWHRFWVAVQGSEVVGAVQAYRHVDGSQEVRSLVVVP